MEGGLYQLVDRCLSNTPNKQTAIRTGVVSRQTATYFFVLINYRASGCCTRSDTASDAVERIAVTLPRTRLDIVRVGAFFSSVAYTFRFQ